MISRVRRLFLNDTPCLLRRCSRMLQSMVSCPMESDHVQGTNSASPPAKAEFAERVRKIQEQAARMGFQSGPTDTVEADKAFMDDMWGED